MTPAATDTLRLSTASLMGIIMMFGIVVSNGVLLVDYTNVLRRRGALLQNAVVTAARTMERSEVLTRRARREGSAR